jgi:hypothetical protein
MSININPPEQGACAKLVASYHRLDEPSRDLVRATIADALSDKITTPSGWLHFREYGGAMIYNAANEIIAEHREIEPSDENEDFEAIIRALRPLVGGAHVIEAVLYDCDDIAADVAGLVRDHMLSRAIAEGDQATMDALDRPFFTAAEWAEYKELPAPDDPEPDDDPPPAAPAANPDELPDHLTRPAGVLGEMVDWITDSAQRPNRVLALGASICVLATIIGRRVAGPTGSGTHLYIVTLAPSASGKDHPQRRASQMLGEINEKLVGPGEFTVQNALTRFVSEQQLALCCMDEFGAFLARASNPKGNAWERGLMKSLREYWGASFETIQGMQWAQQNATPIKWPALSIFGVSTHQEFFDSLSSKEAVNGFLNRFILLSTKQKVVHVDEPLADKYVVPQRINETLTALYSACVGDALFIDKQVKDKSLFNARGQIRIEWDSDEVREEFNALVKFALDKMENADIGELYGRTAEMAIRLATIHAVSRAGLAAKLTYDDLAWGIDLAMWSADTMAREASLRLSDTEAQARAKFVLRIISDARGPLKHRDLNRKLQHRFKPQELRDAIQALMDSGTIRKLTSIPPKGGTTTTVYEIREKPA